MFLLAVATFQQAPPPSFDLSTLSNSHQGKRCCFFAQTPPNTSNRIIAYHLACVAISFATLIFFLGPLRTSAGQERQTPC
mmetsp:Transcript_35509/g.60003  ORF Transcript_35509/g.60003 Transcript_35509/m.60003 type:complete len:80 (-) Transcript_35509:527-766(-)